MSNISKLSVKEPHITTYHNINNLEQQRILYILWNNNNDNKIKNTNNVNILTWAKTSVELIQNIFPFQFVYYNYTSSFSNEEPSTY